jgi:hypothetical protein
MSLKPRIQILYSLRSGISLGYSNRRRHSIQTTSNVNCTKTQVFSYSDTRQTNSQQMNSAVSSGAKLHYVQVGAPCRRSRQFWLAPHIVYRRFKHRNCFKDILLGFQNTFSKPVWCGLQYSLRSTALNNMCRKIHVTFFEMLSVNQCCFQHPTYYAKSCIQISVLQYKYMSAGSHM